MQACIAAQWDGARPPTETMTSSWKITGGSCQWWRHWSEPHWRRVEPICRLLPIASATFYDHLVKRADPSRLLDRAKRDEELKPEIERVFEENLSVYGVRKVWHQMRR